ncbi:1-acyl-sn-glycerol-3-phosphate acyltransferase [Betaproteobacteria bacterium]|nr:1-acyl-sn-glycerol-3-phosphate acyltransferase [Betaproteobacteria bacterium]GHU43673.1 1-acyl-sn-glycerol-3-phosphate acyltransferase [Betaproteobacteria bacterium]
MLEKLLASAFCRAIKLMTGVRALWRENQPKAQPTVYFANHRSHGDFLLIWACLPSALRARTRPVAAADYWLRGAFRHYLIERVFRGVLLDRHIKRGDDPIAVMGAPLLAGESLILFPEGTRNQEDGLLPFKSGIHHLAEAHPQTEFVPVWIENLGRAMPKGGLIPVPLLCSLTFGAPLTLLPDERRADFLARCRTALLALAALSD